MDVDGIGSSSSGFKSPESVLSFEGAVKNEEDRATEIISMQKKFKKSGFEESERAWEDKIMPLLSFMINMDYLPRMYGEVVMNALKDKNHLLFVCFYLPPQFSEDFEFDSVYPEDFIPACRDLYSYRDDFEIVLVTKMNAVNPNSEPNYFHPFTPFPSSSLVIPFNDDSQSRTFICNILQPDEPDGFSFHFKCVFVNVEEKTLIVGQPNSMSSLVDHLKDLVGKSSFDALRSYHRLLKTMWPVKSCLPSIPCPIARIFKHVKPEYSESVNYIVPILPPIQIGHTLDVNFLLSGGTNELDYLVRKDGEQVDFGKAIKDKYIMVCCFHAPVFRDDFESKTVQQLINIYTEMYAQRVDFETVVVVKMKKQADYKQIFDHFLSAFPSSCFVIPFEDLNQRDFICKYLNLEQTQCLLLDKKGTDAKKNILFHGYPMFARSYGADAFPFSNEKLQKLQADELPSWKTPATNNLVGLLNCKLSDVLKKTNAEDGCDTVTISDLNKTDVVGLFLCVSGNRIPKLQEVYEQCKTQQKPFEILLVYLPFNDSLDPQNYKLYVDNLLQKHKLSLWYMPFDNSVSHKLFRLTRRPISDQLIIFRAQDASIDPYGGKLISTSGVDAYPFTREELVQRELNKLKGLTLETLLITRSYLLKGKTVIPVADLRGKNILLWISSLSFDDTSFCHQLLNWYKINRAKNPDFEVVLVRKHNSTAPDDDLTLAGVMPWLICPFNADHSAFVQEKLFPIGGLGDNALVEFGTDGLVCSLTAEYLLSHVDDESGNIPFGGSNLRKGVIKNLFRLYGDYMLELI